MPMYLVLSMMSGKAELVLETDSESTELSSLLHNHALPPNVVYARKIDIPLGLVNILTLTVQSLFNCRCEGLHKTIPENRGVRYSW